MCKSCGSNQAPLRSLEIASKEITVQSLFDSGKYKLVRYSGRTYTTSIGSPTGVIAQDGLRNYGRGKHGDYLLVHVDDIQKTPQNFILIQVGSIGYQEALAKYGLQEDAMSQQASSIAGQRAVKKAEQDVKDAEQRAEDIQEAAESGNLIDGVVQDGVEGDAEMNLSKVDSLRGENAPAKENNETEESRETESRQAQSKNEALQTEERNAETRHLKSGEAQSNERVVGDTGGRILSREQAMPLKDFQDSYGFTHHMQVMAKVKSGELQSYKDDDGKTWIYHHD